MYTLGTVIHLFIKQYNMNKQYKAQLESMNNDPSVHNIVKEIVNKLDDHDPVDALHDIEMVLALCKARLTRE